MTNGNSNNTSSTTPKSTGALAGSGSSLKEAAIGLLAGVCYGFTSPVIGHPFDTVKTRMQAEAQFQGTTVAQTVRQIYRVEGWRGFYRGFVPPLLGSMAFRGTLFSAYSGTYAAAEQMSALNQPIPWTGGLRPSVLCGAVAAAVARSSIESPFDYIKVRYMLGEAALKDTAKGATKLTLAQNARQTLQQFAASPITSIQHLYRGFGATFLRTLGLLGSFFIMVDYSVRYIPHVVEAPLVGPFFKGGLCATAAWVPAFPLETAKSLIQGDITGKYRGKSTAQVLYLLYQEKGIVRGWYRGFGPGASRSFVANGASMFVYSYLQDLIRS